MYNDRNQECQHNLLLYFMLKISGVVKKGQHIERGFPVPPNAISVTRLENNPVKLTPGIKYETVRLEIHFYASLT
jgi:hypothetical protein